jgi:hypothetical protein
MEPLKDASLLVDEQAIRRVGYAAGDGDQQNAWQQVIQK